MGLRGLDSRTRIRPGSSEEGWYTYNNTIPKGSKGRRRIVPDRSVRGDRGGSMQVQVDVDLACLYSGQGGSCGYVLGGTAGDAAHQSRMRMRLGKRHLKQGILTVNFCLET